VFHGSILYQWAHCYYLISAPLFLDKNRGGESIFRDALKGKEVSRLAQNKSDHPSDFAQESPVEE
jgi:hypothetical protein